MSTRANIEAALAATADRLSPGSGASAVSHFKSDITMIASSPDDSIRRHTTGDISIAVPAVFESKRPDGDPVTIEKPRDGLIVVYAAGLVVVRPVAFGARESKAFGAGDVSVEKITTVINGTDVPGLRITAHGGKPKFAVAIGQAEAPANSAQQAAVRDEVYELITK
jgi:hypothetical protein